MACEDWELLESSPSSRLAPCPGPCPGPCVRRWGGTVPVEWRRERRLSTPTPMSDVSDFRFRKVFLQIQWILKRKGPAAKVLLFTLPEKKDRKRRR